jgi:hypothetical protein
MNSERHDIEIHDTPLMPGGDYDLRAAWELVRDACANGAFEATVVIEDTISIPHKARGEGFIPASDKVLHESLGIWRALCASFRLQAMLVHPKTWKAAMLTGVANDAKAEEAVLLQRFRGLLDPKALRGSKGGARTGRVDSLWLAEFARVQWRIRANVTDRTVQM